MSTNSGTLLIGCPVLRREWIIDKWLTHALTSVLSMVAPPQFAFLFVGDESDPTFSIIDKWCKVNEVTAYLHHEPEARDFDCSWTKRDWGAERYERMTDLRNKLLSRVREMAPEHFLSLDSDMLLHHQAMRNLYESIERFDAVGGKAYLYPKGKNVTTYGMFQNASGSGLRRHDADGVFPVNVIMAIKLMSERAYNVDYKTDKARGEDIGWSLNCRDAGVKLGWDGRVCSKHVMDPTKVDEIDPRLGW